MDVTGTFPFNDKQNSYLLSLGHDRIYNAIMLHLQIQDSATFLLRQEKVGLYTLPYNLHEPLR